jgi:hypothetical protein
MKHAPPVARFLCEDNFNEIFFESLAQIFLVFSVTRRLKKYCPICIEKVAKTVAEPK